MTEDRDDPAQTLLSLGHGEDALIGPRSDNRELRQCWEFAAWLLDNPGQASGAHDLCEDLQVRPFGPGRRAAGAAGALTRRSGAVPCGAARRGARYVVRGRRCCMPRPGPGADARPAPRALRSGAAAQRSGHRPPLLPGVASR
jgi:hypothetical protein